MQPNISINVHVVDRIGVDRIGVDRIGVDRIGVENRKTQLILKVAKIPAVD